MVVRHLSYLIILSPAVVLSLNRNWDIWVILPMFLSIYLFERKRFYLSAIWLGIAVATKFFPIVLLIPIGIGFLRERRYTNALEYAALSMGTWLVINLPAMFYDFNGWYFFYDLSLKRGLGDGSVYSIFQQLGYKPITSSLLYYGLNLCVLGILTMYLFRPSFRLSLSSAAFLAVAAFTFFGKQYSMQYVLWLAPLAVLGISFCERRTRAKVIGAYLCWQVTEFVFHQAYYQNLLSRILESRGQLLQNPWTDFEYGIAALVRYLVFAGFIVLYMISTARSSRISGSSSKSEVRVSRKKR